MSYLIISIAIQAALIIHCIRTGRNSLWIWAIALLPLAGPIAYVLVELLPSVLNSQGTQRAVRGMSRALDPEQDLRRLAAEASGQGDVASRQRYAAELIRQGRPQEAIGLYRQILKGLYEFDPDLLLGLAQAQFAAGEATAARTTLDTLREHNPDFRSADGHLLYARALAAEGDLPRALSEFAALMPSYSGAEAPLHYARTLRAAGRIEDARRVLRELLDHARQAPRHYRKMQQEWLDAAERELAGLQ